MRRKGVLLLLAGLAFGIGLGLLVILSGPGSARAGERRLPPTVGSPVRDFSLPTLDGKTSRLSDLRGKPVLVNFWATWCGPCKVEMPLLQGYAQKYAGRLVVLGVDYAEEPDVVRPFVAEQGVSFPILLDQNGQVADLYFVRNFPATFFIDSDGILRAQHLGLLTDDLLEKYLKTIGVAQ